MTKPAVTIYLASVTFNGHTYDKTVGGPQAINAEVGGTNRPFFSGDAQWPVFNPIVEKQGAITVELSEYLEAISIDTTGDLVITITKPDLTTISVTYRNMKFAGSTAGQSFARYSVRVLRWVYEAADGTTPPVA